MTEEGAGRKTKVRGGHRAHTTKIFGEIDALLEDHSSQDEAKFIDFRARLQKKAEIVGKLDESILDEKETDAEIATEIEDAEGWHNGVREKMNKIESVIKTMSKKAPGASWEWDENSSRHGKPTTGSRMNVKLPKYDIEKFSGDPKSYLEFKDAFEVAITKNTSLQDVEKFTYLRSFLKGEALQLIAGLAVTEHNFIKAWDMIEKRFGNKQRIIDSHMDALMKISPVREADDKSLRQLHDSVEMHLRSLETLGIESNQFGSLLVPILREKIPSDVNLIISRRFDADDDLWTISAMMKELKTELEARERCPAQVKSPIAQKKTPITLEGLLVQNSAQKDQLCCPYCEKKHYADKCRIVTNVQTRKDILKNKNRCFKCTRSGHMARECTSRRTCFKCQGKHHTSICGEAERRDTPNADQNREIPEAQPERPPPPTTTMATVASTTEGNEVTLAKQTKDVLLQTARVPVCNPLPEGASVNCRIILDNCSQATYITRRLRDALQLDGCGNEDVAIGGFGGSLLPPKNLDMVRVGMQCCNSEIIYVIAFVTEKICSPLQGQVVNVAKESFSHLQGIPLADENDGGPIEVEMLIGADYYWSIITDHVIRGEKGPVALSSKFGYILSGSAPHSHAMIVSQPSTNLLASCFFNEDASGIDVELRRFWELESIGIKEEGEKVKEIEDDIRREGLMYVRSLPWKEDHPMLGDNFALTMKRLATLIKSLKKRPKLLQNYAEIFEELEKAGIIEEVGDPKRCVVGKTYYMPHLLVIREGKVRIVYHCSSKEKGEVSLNECLYTGETFFTDLLGVLLRFRLHKIALLADIEKAFLRVGIEEDDRDAMRFVVARDVNAEKIEVRHMRFTRVCFGVVSSMGHLGSTIGYHLKQQGNGDLVCAIEDSLYVDDYAGGAADDQAALKLMKDAKELFQKANMNLRGWRSNSPVVENEILQSEGGGGSGTDSYAQMMLNPKCRSGVKVLGVPWDLENDDLVFSLQNVVRMVNEDGSGERVTKRQLLRYGGSGYDPTGGLAPILLEIKVLFQRVCIDGGDWDTHLKEQHQKAWEQWIKGVRDIPSFRVKRFYGAEDPGKTEVMLVGFSDASEKAYAAVVYIRTSTRGVEGWSMESNLVVCKTRVAPVRKQTIPRLELLGAVMLARLMKQSREILSRITTISKEVCLTDSSIVLCWVQGTGKEYKNYVEARAREIRSHTGVETWNHVPGDQNIADLPSRGCLPEKLLTEKEKWFHGPHWMKKEFSAWPVSKTAEIKEDDDEELKVKKIYSCLVINTDNLEKVIDPNRYSSLERLLRVTAYCIRFIEKCKKHAFSKKKESVKEEHGDTELSAEEIDEARKLWVKCQQQKLKSTGTFKKTAESLGIEEDGDGFLRCRGRIGRSKVPMETKLPLILPSRSYFTELIIRECHDNVFHNGVRETLTQLRSRYWVVKGRQRVKTVLRRCRLCKILEGLPYPAPPTSELPEFRVNESKAFEYVGVDFCGPVYIKRMYQSKADVRAKMEKAYIVLFTCATSRMVHLELCPDLTTEAYIRSQRRMMGRRGTPSMIFSDNGRTFRGRKLKKFNSARGTRWRFNLARAPWWGGAFERMIKSTKRCLVKAVGSDRLTYEELLTVLIEAEAVLNSRPLTYVYEDELVVPLTPSHLYCGRRLLDKEPLNSAFDEEEDFNAGRGEAVLRADRMNRVANHFWKRWVQEYLTGLREVHKGKKCSAQPKIKIGDVVLIQEDGVKRQNWKMGRIEEVVTGKDGIVRGAVLKTGKDGVEGRVSRPLQKLCPLEITEPERIGDSAEDIEDETVSHEEKSSPLQAEDTSVPQGSIGSPPAADRSSVPQGSIPGPTSNDSSNLQQKRSTSSSSRPQRMAGLEGERRRRANENEALQRGEDVVNVMQ